MECDLSWVAVSTCPQKPRRKPQLMAKVLLGKQRLTAFLDSGSSISMIWSHLLPAALPVLGWACVSCLHCHTQRMLIVWTCLRYAGRHQELNVVRAKDLPWPLLLDRDAPDFMNLLRQVTAEEQVWAADDDPKEGTSRGSGGADTAHPTTRPGDAWLRDAKFHQAQEDDPFLWRLRQSIAVDDGQVKDVRRAGCLPQIEQVQGLWWRLVPPTPGNPTGW